MCLTLCDFLDCSTTRTLFFFPRELAHIHVYWIGDAICCICLILCHPFLHLPSIFLNIRILKMSRLFALSSQSIEASASASVLPMNIHGWFPLELTGLISLLSRGSSLLQHHNSKASFLWQSAFFMVQLSHLCTTTGETIALARWTFVGKVMSLLFNILSRLVIAFLPRSVFLFFNLFFYWRVIALQNFVVFLCSLAICMSSSVKCLFRSFSHFFDWVVCFLVLSCMSCLYTLEINTLSVVSFVIIFSQSEGCLFTLLIVSFAVQKLLSLIRSHLFTFVFISVTLGGGS